MSDFSPSPVKAAARAAMVDLKANGRTNWTEYSAGAYRATFHGREVRIAFDGRGAIIGRVIDTDGRHYFPAEFETE